MFGLARVRASVSQFVNALYVSRLQRRGGDVGNTLSVYIYTFMCILVCTYKRESGNTTFTQ